MVLLSLGRSTENIKFSELWAADPLDISLAEAEEHEAQSHFAAMLKDQWELSMVYAGRSTEPPHDVEGPAFTYGRDTYWVGAQLVVSC